MPRNNLKSDQNIVLTTAEVFLYKNAISELKRHFYQPTAAQSNYDIYTSLLNEISSYQSDGAKETYLADLETKIDNLTPIQITIPIFPNQKLLDQIKNVFLNSSTDLELIIEVDPSIVSGAIITYKGHYLNQSLKQNLNGF